MARNEMEVILSLKDQLTDKLKEASRGIDNFAATLRSTGRDISQVGNTLAIFGGSIVGVFSVALNKASKDSLAVKNELNKLNTVFKDLNVQIATAVLPTVQKFTSIIQDLVYKFNQLDKPMRDKILNFTLMGGAIAIVLGLMTSFVGKTFGLVSALLSLSAASLGTIATIGGVGIAIIALIALMLKFKPVSDAVINTFEVMFIFLKNGFHTISAAFFEMLARIFDGLNKFSEQIGKLPSVLGAFVRSMNGQLGETADALHKMAGEDISKVIEQTKELNNIFSGGNGQWVMNFDEGKAKLEEFVGSIINLKNEASTIGDSFSGFRTVMEGFKVDATTSFDTMKTAAKQFTDSVFLGIGQMIVQGENFGKIITSAFKQMGSIFISEILKMIVHKILMAATEKAAIVATVAAAIPAGAAVAAAWAPAALMANIASFGGAGAAAAGTFGVAAAAQLAAAASSKAVGVFHDGGMIKAHDGLAVDEVPIIAQTGEGVLSRKGMRALGGSQELSRLNRGEGSEKSSGSSNVINIFIQKAELGTAMAIEQTAEMLGFSVERSLRTARGI